MISRFSVIQNSIANRLSLLGPIKSPPNKDTNFRSSLVIPVEESGQGDWKKEVTSKIKRVGLGILVRKGRYSYTPPLETYPFTVEIVETPVLNRGEMGSQLTAERAMETVCEGLRNWAPVEWCSECTSLSVDSKEGTQQLTYVVAFNVRAHVSQRTREL